MTTTTQPPEPEIDDAALVTFVLEGDLTRYELLVNRYQRRIYAIAWSRSGDTALAEEATQETFIRAYQKLFLLSDKQKFGSWISTIAQNVSANLAIRNRRELLRRTRWALETFATEPTPELDPADAEEPDAGRLQAALQKLSPAYRECLILFHLEGKSGAQAAAALGISPTAFRVRLHRARADLRSELESTLSSSLQKLRPPRTIVPAVMAGVFATSSAKGATFGTAATVTGALAKVLPLAWIASFLPWFSLLPLPFTGWLYARAESSNFRESDGFRARLLRKAVKARMLWLLPTLIGVLWISTTWKGILAYSRPAYLFFGFSTLFAGVLYLRIRTVVRNRYFSANLLASAVSGIAWLLIGFRILPSSFFFPSLALQLVLMAAVFAERPVRMDYNLFLRAAEGLLAIRSPVQPSAHQSLTCAEQILFARFLGSRWLITNFRWTGTALQLRIPETEGLSAGLFEHLRPFRGASILSLEIDGTVCASLAARDRDRLARFHQVGAAELSLFEHHVSVALNNAWEFFRRADLASAENALGERPESEVFRTSLSKTKITHWYQRISIAFAALVLLMTLIFYFQPHWLEGLKPVTLTEPQVRAALADFQPETSVISSNLALAKGLTSLLFFGLEIPTADLFTPSSLQLVRAQILRDSSYRNDPDPNVRCRCLMMNRTLAGPINAGWLQLSDFDLTSQDLTEFCAGKSAPPCDFRLGNYLARTPNGDLQIEKADPLTLSQLRFLHHFDCLRFLDRRGIARQIAKLQVRPPGQNSSTAQLRNWRDLKGLFVTFTAPVLEDTYCQLAALDLLGRLEYIDREACVRAILKLHRGGGSFASPDTEESWSFQVRGDARDTFCAFESLRILKALDRVTDWRTWKFRLKPPSKNASRPGSVTWEQIEAWLYVEHLGKS